MEEGAAAWSDLDRKTMRAEAINLVEERSRLPPIVQAELKKLTKLSKNYNVSGMVAELEGPKEEKLPHDPMLDGTEAPGAQVQSYTCLGNHEPT